MKIICICKFLFYFIFFKQTFLPVLLAEFRLTTSIFLKFLLNNWHRMFSWEQLIKSCVVTSAASSLKFLSDLKSEVNISPNILNAIMPEIAFILKVMTGSLVIILEVLTLHGRNYSIGVFSQLTAAVCRRGVGWTGVVFKYWRLCAQCRGTLWFWALNHSHKPTVMLT